MFGKVFQRTWVSPIVVLSFAVVGISGVLMLLHVRVPGMKGIHEWMGVVLFTAGMVHLLINWKPFWGYLRNRSAIAAIVAVAALFLILLFGAGGEDARHGRPPMGPRGGDPPVTAQTSFQE